MTSLTRRRFSQLTGVFAGVLSALPILGRAEDPSRRRRADRNKPRLLHIAWFRFKPTVSREQIEKHFAACRDLVNRVPVVLDLECGPNLTDRADGMTHGIVVSLRDQAAIAEYLEHPAHVPVATALKTDVAELRVMDLQV